jgi:hypothetical protein
VDTTELVMGAIRFLASSDDDARFLVFKRAVLARAEVNGNNDQLDVPGLEQVAATIAGTAIDIEHKPTENFGVLTAGKVENGVLYVDGYFWRDRLIEADVSPQDIEAGKWKLSIEATADEAECSECGNLFRSAHEYCDHLKNRIRSEAVRILRGLKASGGALTKNPAGTDTVFRRDSIYVVASHAEKQEPPPELTRGISLTMHGISAETAETAVAIQDRWQETQIDEFLALSISAGIHRRDDVSDADRSRAQEEFGIARFADPANSKFPIRDEEHIRNAWSRINQALGQKAYGAEEVETIKRRIVAAWKKVIDSEGPPGANKEEANMPEDNKDPVAAGDNTVTPADSRLADLQAQVQSLQEQIDAQASQITDLTSTVEERDNTIAERDQAVVDLTERVTAARTENLRTRLIGSVMELEEFETQAEMLLGLPEEAIGLMVSAAQRNAAPDDNGNEDDDEDNSGEGLSVLASDDDAEDGEVVLTAGED